MKRRLPQILLVAITLAAWGWAPFGEFHFDDFPTILRDGATVDARLLGWRLFHGVRPLLRISFFLDHAVWGFHPGPWLAENLLLHVGSVLLVFALARRKLDEPGAFAAAALFGLQPAAAEVVCYVSGRSTGLMTLFVLAALLFRERRSAPGEIACFVAACLTKEVAIVYPLLAWLWKTEAPAIGARTLAAVTGVIAAALAGLHRYRHLAAYSLGVRSPPANLLQNGRAVPEMVSLWVRPWALTVDHAFVPSGHPVEAWLGLLLIAALIALAWSLRERAPLATLAIGWVLLALAPTNSLIAKLDLVTEKPLYLAWVGPCLFLGDLLAPRRRLAAAALAVALAWGAAWTVWRVSLWHDARRLWLDAVSKAPHKSRCWDDLGMAFLTHDEYPPAEAAFLRALELDPHNERAGKNLETVRSLCGVRCREEIP